MYVEGGKITAESLSGGENEIIFRVTVRVMFRMILTILSILLVSLIYRLTRIQRGGWCGLHYTHRATTALSWGLCEHRDHASRLAASLPRLLVLASGMVAD